MLRTAARTVTQQIPVEQQAKAVIAVAADAGRVDTVGPIAGHKSQRRVSIDLDLDLRGVTHPAGEQADPALERAREWILQ